MLGDIGALRELVGRGARPGIRVVLDGVFNHCGDGHGHSATSSSTAPTRRTWAGSSGRAPGQPASRTRLPTCVGLHYLPKLNLTTRRCATIHCEVATALDRASGIDGWRLDVPFKVTHEFWEQFRDTVHGVDPNAYLLGEVWRDAVPWLDVFDGTTNYRQRANILGYCLDDSLDAEDFGQETAELAASHGGATNWMVNLVGSHDTARVLTLAGGDRDRTLCAIAAMFTLPGVPLLYYGDEIGLDGDDDPGCRKAMRWDEATWDSTIFDAVVALSAARRHSPALRRGGFTRRLARNGLIAFERATVNAEPGAIGDDRVVVVLNPRERQTGVVIPLDIGSAAGCWRDVMTGATMTSTERGLAIDHVAARSFTILRREPSEAHDR